MGFKDPKAASNGKALPGAGGNPRNRSRRREKGAAEESLRARRAQHSLSSVLRNRNRDCETEGEREREREREKNESESETRNPILEGSENCSHQRGPHRTVFVFDGFEKWVLVGVLFPRRKTDYSV
ncbi:hypothetical protein TIFTF001_003438 [Ficus carica]|uniref:Uncharacterized protein n=1 Tax=Ficus carica TaxID=3494 RepID=A0AA87ZRQ0_FICCA|nr:hypothetical protein TIFTF001_003438 [Ficus carica]